MKQKLRPIVEVILGIGCLIVLLVAAAVMTRVFGVSSEVAWDLGVMVPLVTTSAILAARQRRNRR